MREFDALLRDLSSFSGGPEILVAVRLGRVEYDAALELQEHVRERRVRGEVPDLLLLLEHPPVYTLGRGADPADLGAARDGAVPIRRVGRGGAVTFHGPGQVIGYPIVALRGPTADVKGYLRALESALIRAVSEWELAAGRVPGATGVWVEGRKLASIGIGVRCGVTTHGFALNVSTDLSYFTRIVPCGLQRVRMTSLADEGLDVATAAVEESIARALTEILGYRGLAWVRRAPDAAIPPSRPLAAVMAMAGS
jgi:lipoyl(octanoyl) transferase